MNGKVAGSMDRWMRQSIRVSWRMDGVDKRIGRWLGKWALDG